MKPLVLIHSSTLITAIKFNQSIVINSETYLSLVLKYIGMFEMP